MDFSREMVDLIDSNLQLGILKWCCLKEIFEGPPKASQQEIRFPCLTDYSTGCVQNGLATEVAEVWQRQGVEMEMWTALRDI
ncbi:hypothetical protein VULLAG_LOCUS11590 [Vulpes lagopus]